MRFIRFDGERVTVEFEKKRMMHKILLERRKSLLEEALRDAFGAPVSLVMTVEGSGEAAGKKLGATARDVINQSYDVFGRDKIELVD